jgi:hypothetical protein
MSRQATILYFDCDPEVMCGDTQIQVTLPKKKIYIRPALKEAIPVTLGSEVDAALKEWYETRGLPIPPEELGLGAQIDAANEAEGARLTEAQAKWEKEHVSSEKPEFGTPAFWAWARAQRAQKNKERADAGLPPLPTAKEKEAAKVARAAAKAAKAVAKA